MPDNSADEADLSQRLQRATNELRDLEEALLAGSMDVRVLSDFRDAVNRVRQTAWAVQQVLETHASGEKTRKVVTILAAERVKVAYQLCRVLLGDLRAGELSFSREPLVPLYLATRDLSSELAHIMDRPEVPRA
jgi:hypothetical protein